MLLSFYAGAMFRQRCYRAFAAATQNQCTLAAATLALFSARFLSRCLFYDTMLICSYIITLHAFFIDFHTFC